MPAFFIVSGILMNYSRSLQKSFGKFLWAKIYSLFFPMLFFEVIGAVRDILKYGYTQSAVGYLYNFLHLKFNAGTNWFLFSLLVAELAFYFLRKPSPPKWVIGTVGAAAFAVGVLLPADVYYAEIAGEALIAFSFLIVGYLGASLFQKENFLALAVSAFVTLALTYFNGPVDLSGKVLNNPVLFLIGGIGGTYLVIGVGRKIKLSALSYFGKNTLSIFATHSLLIFLFERAFAQMPPLPAQLLTLVLVVALEFPIVYLLDKYAPFLIGKKRVRNE